MEETPDLRRLRWKCRRGMLELDRLLLNFLNLGYNELTPKEKTVFEKLIANADQDLLIWLLACGKAPLEFDHVIEKIRADAQA